MVLRIRILMMSPTDENGKINPNVKEYVSRWNYYGLQAKLEANHDIMKKWLSSLPSRTKQRIEVRSYFNIPVANYLLIDQGELRGYIQVELPIFYGLDLENLPHYIVRRKDDENFFQQHIDSFENLWQKSYILLGE